MSRLTFSPRWPAIAAVALTLGGAAIATSQSPTTGVPPGPAAGLWISDSPLQDGRRLLIVVDPATRHAAVYHVDPAAGGLTLKSARNITWDLSLDEFNVQEPRPAAIRTMLQSAPPGSP